MAYQPDGDRGQNLNPILNVGAASTLKLWLSADRSPRPACGLYVVLLYVYANGSICAPI